MAKERRQWSKDQKLQIIQEVEVNGLQPTLRKYNLSQSLFHKWKRTFNEQGAMGLEPQYSKVDPEKRKMEQEIKRLRELVGELSLELRFKDELLKKKPVLISDTMQVIEAFEGQVSITKRLLWSSLNPSSYYYVAKNGKPGRKPSPVNLKIDGSTATNYDVVEEIKNILGIEFLCYGYKPVTDELFDRGFIVNHKKVYRLMKQHKLLCGKSISTHFGTRKFVRFRKIRAEYPLQYLCMDIKYIPINGKFAYLLSLIDVYTRKIVGYVFKQSIRQHDVLWLLKNVLPEKANTPITLRNDNGSQFIAKSVRAYLDEINVVHEFTHIATPEDNAYIEAFHSIMERELVSRYEFDSFHHADMKITQYIFTYNNIRKHGSLGLRTPAAVWNEYFFRQSSDKQLIAAKPEELSRFFEEKNPPLELVNQELNIFSSKTQFNLYNSRGGAKFDYLMANDVIKNYICKNSQTIFDFYSS